MKIFAKVFPNSKEENITKNDDGSLSIRVKVPAKDGKANKAVIKVLAKYFKVPKSFVDIKVGHTSKSKIIEIEI